MIRSLTNNFALSALEDNTSGPLNRRCTADLPSLRTLLAIRQKSWEPSFWEVMDSFVSVAYATLATSRTLLQWLPACLNLYIPNIYFVSANKKWFLHTMAAAQAAENHGDEWGLTWYIQWGIYTSIPTWTHSQNSLAEFKDILPWNITNGHKDHPNQHKNNHRLCNEMEHPVLSLLESQWKLRYEHDQNFPMEGKPL